MSYELLFWALMIGWLIYLFVWYAQSWIWGVWGHSIFLWVLLALLGFKVYGAMLHG